MLEATISWDPPNPRNAPRPSKIKAKTSNGNLLSIFWMVANSFNKSIVNSAKAIGAKAVKPNMPISTPA